MEVTKSNFKEVLATLPQIFNNAQFISLDTEFTGLKVQGSSGINYFDDLEQVYAKDKEKSETFIAIQFGIVAFTYDEPGNKYKHHAFNFYVYPSTLNHDVNFTCQASSIEFLIKHGFDFNKLFGDGIPYMRDDQAEQLVAKLQEKSKQVSKAVSTKETKVPVEHEETLKQIHKGMETLLQTQGKTYTIGRHNRFVRSLIYNTTREKFGNKVHLETLKDETMVASFGLSQKQCADREKERFSSSKQEIIDAVGFSNVITLIIESGKLLIGHNVFMDLLFTIQQCVQALPPTYTAFKQILHFVFPKIIDTKYFATLTEFRGIKDSYLQSLADELKEVYEVPVVEVAEDGCGYSDKESKHHEAAYDAYLTGLCFLTMAHHIGKLNKTNILKTLPTSPLLEPVLNKLYVMRLHEIQYFNISGPDQVPDRSNVFHLTLPNSWKRDEVFKLFKEYGFINLAWINDTSAFVGVKKEQLANVQKNLVKPNQVYTLIPYNEYARKPSNSEKRSQQEDVGTVIRRPNKKKCSFEVPSFE